MTDIILEAIDLVRHFTTGGGFLSDRRKVRAVDGVSLRIRKGETFAIVGESGCGKSTLARLLMQLLDPTSGDVLFEGRRVSGQTGQAQRDLRRDMQFIFQDPFASLNPRMTVGQLVGEPLEIHAKDLDATARRARVAALLAKVGLLAEHANRYPHEFSGGQRQRIGIARALASGPRLLIGDEPVSALDVSVQAQVINLLDDLKQQLDLTLVLIAHDLAVIRHMSDRVAVMYLGRIVETGPVDQIFARPRHPYTQTLLAAIPVAEHRTARAVLPDMGEIPSPLAPPSGCHFHTRCLHARPDCATNAPALDKTGSPDHAVACLHWRQIAPPADRAAPTTRSEGAQARMALYRAALDRGSDAKPNTNERG